MNKQLYALKDVGNLILKPAYINSKYVVDYANEIYIQTYKNSDNRKNTLIIMFTQMVDDNMPNDNVYISLESNYRNTDNNIDESRIIKYDFPFDLVYSAYTASCEYPSEFVYVFCDGNVNSGYIKKEINEILNRRQICESINNLSNEIRNNNNYYNNDDQLFKKINEMHLMDIVNVDGLDLLDKEGNKIKGEMRFIDLINCSIENNKYIK